MNRWLQRSAELELLDLGPAHYTKEVYEDCLLKLDKIGRWLGGDLATFRALRKIDPAPLSILDVGCGGGLFTSRLAMQYPKAKVVGIDLNPDAIAFAKKRVLLMKNPPKNVTFETRTQPQLEETKKSYDVVLSTLVCHHLSDAELSHFISQASTIARQGVIINDLHRHPLAFYLFKIISPLFFRNHLVQHDGPLSICRAFKYQEWIHYLNRAGLKSSQYSIKWHCMFRWIVQIQCKGVFL